MLVKMYIFPCHCDIPFNARSDITEMYFFGSFNFKETGL